MRPRARTKIVAFFAVMVTSVMVGLCQASWAEPLQDEPILPVPLNIPINKTKAALGEKLFKETLLSLDNTVSCQTCHNVAKYGVDGTPSSTGVKQQVGTVNSPTVINSRFNFAQFWDGRAKDLHEQVSGPITNPIEMGAEWDLVIKRLNADASYRKSFQDIYEEGITQDTISDAISNYERTLISVNAPFDQYLRGADTAITAQQKRGYKLFKEYGCVACHQGVNVGGNMYQKMGAFLPYFTDANTNTADDYGRYNVTQSPEDLHVFKVPGLRVAAFTGPYFHDGSVKTLREAIDIMARYQLGHDIPQQDNQDIEAFIYSLVGDIKGQVHE